MKNLKNYFFIMLAVIGLGFLASCGGDEETPGPSITIVNPPATTAAAGAALAFSLSTTAEGKIESITITEKNGANTSTLTTRTSFTGTTEDTYIYNYTVPASTGGTVELTFTVLDKNGKSASTTHTITVSGSATGTMNSYTAKILGAQNATAGSFMNAVSGTIYNQSTAGASNASQALVDFVYYSVTNGGSVIAAPLNSDASVSNGVNGWTTKNATKFQKQTTDNFAAATASTLTALNSANITGTTAANLAVGDVYAFVTAGGKKGLFKVTALTAGATGSVTIDVKVLQ